MSALLNHRGYRGSQRRDLWLAFSLVVMSALAAGAQQANPQATAPKPPEEAQQKARPWEQIPVPPLPAFHPQEPRRIELPNGMVIFLQEDHELPVIGGSMTIRGGAVLEPAEKTGMLDIYGEVWRTGGTSKRTGDELDDFLEARAAKVETDDGEDSTVISFNCLKQDFSDVFPVFLELLREPAFRDDKIALAQREMDTSIARRNENSADIAGREAVKLAYGRANPYARTAEYATVAAVTRQDLLAWHQRFVHPNNIILGVYGDFDAAQMEARLRQAFGSWERGPQAEPPKIAYEPAKPGLYFAEKDDVNQSEIRLLGLGTEKKNPDYYALVVMNEVLGGGFASRLFTNIRSKLGLAYSVGGGVGTGWDHPGITAFSMGTKSATTGESVEALRKELNDLLTSPPTDVEIRRAKDSILNGFIFNFDTKAKVLFERIRYEFYGYPPDFLERFRAGIEKVTREDVERVAHKYVHPEQLAVLVVGNAQEVTPQLSKLGPVTKLNISIPPPPAQKPGQERRN